MRLTTVATIDMSRKKGGCFAPFARAGSPSSTMWPGPKVYFLTSSVIQLPSAFLHFIHRDGHKFFS